jgi:hypothetical protein
MSEMVRRNGPACRQLCWFQVELFSIFSGEEERSVVFVEEYWYWLREDGHTQRIPPA